MPVSLQLSCVLVASLLSPFALATGIQAELGSDQFIGKIIQVILALAVTLGLIWGLSKIAINKRWAHGAANQRIKVLDSLAVGTRDRIMLIEVDNQNILVASTPGQIRSLHSFEKSRTESFQNVLSAAGSDGIGGGPTR